jgi:hypothetical protein
MEIREMLCRLIWSPEQLKIVGSAACDCGEIVRHNNGGNYHRKVWVFRADGEFAVVFGSTRDWFVGDEEWLCEDCHVWVRDDEDHRHYSIEEVEELEREIVDYIGEGGVVYLLTVSGETIGVRYL